MSDTTAPPVDDVLRACGLATLGDDPAMDAVEAAVRALAEAMDGADPLRRETLREGAIRALRAAAVGAPARMLDAILGQQREDAGEGSGQGRAVVLSDPEPWPEPVDGMELLDQLVNVYDRHLAQPEAAGTVEALWTLHAHAHDAATVSPLLAFTSPTKRCGKTTALTLVGALVPRSLPVSSITAAALFRTVEALNPTLLVDEADTFLSDREELRGVLNSGHTGAGAFVVRTVGDDFEPRVFRTWGPKVIAMIGDLPDSLFDRSVVVRLRRRQPREDVERLRLDRLGELEPLRRQCARWAADHLEELRRADPDVPPELHDRAADNWRPLLAIADAAGGSWPVRARQAAVALSGVVDDDGDAGVLVLGDLRDLYGQRGVDRMPSAEIVQALGQMEERPWPEWRRGQPITVRQLAGLLRPYGVSPTQYRIGPDRARGYDRADLEDAWTRYLPQAPPQNRDKRDNHTASVYSGGLGNRDMGGPVTNGESGDRPTAATDVTDVTDGDPAFGEYDYETVEREAIQAESDL